MSTAVACSRLVTTAAFIRHPETWRSSGAALHRCTVRSMRTATPTALSFANVPGVWLLNNFISPAEHAAAHAAAIDLSSQVHGTALALPKETISPAHNVNTEGKFKSVVFDHPGGQVFGAHPPNG